MMRFLLVAIAAFASGCDRLITIKRKTFNFAIAARYAARSRSLVTVAFGAVVWLLPLLIFGGHANAQTTAVAFGALRVPGKYVNQEQLLVAGSVFDNDDIDQIALVIPDSEVRNCIANYAVEAGSNRVRRIRLSLREIDSAALNNNLVAEFAARQPNSYVREADKYTAYERWYNARSAWVLVNTVDNQTRQIARCQRIEAGKGVDACIFSENIEGYGVQFRLENENIALAYEFKEFIRSKIHQWTGNPPENE